MPFIKSFSVYTHCNDLGGKVWNPAIRWTKKYAVFIVLENNEGVQGLGECWCFDSAPDALLAFLRTEVAPHILKCSMEEYPEVYKKLLTAATLTARHGMLASALSGVDIAMWDLQSRTANQPLWSFLNTINASRSGGDGSLQLYGSGGLYGKNKSTKDLTKEMHQMTEAGFSIVKMKVGALSLSEDVKRVHAVLDSLDESCKIIIDGVYSYSVSEALQLYRSLPDSRIEAFQSPLEAADLTGMQTLCEAGVPVMATEAEYRKEVHQQLVELGSVKYLQTAPVACGGITKLNELISLIAASKNSSIRLSLEVSSTAVALAAACHFAAANNRVAHTEYHYVHQVFTDELNLQKVPEHPGRFRLTAAAGLGITLPMSAVNHEYKLTS